MRKKLNISSPVRRTLMLISIPLVLSSTAHAIFSQQLSVAGNVTKPAYASSANLSISYARTVTASGGNWSYQISATITNNGSKGVTDWQSDFDLPNDYFNLSCSNSICSQSGTTNTAINTGTNGFIGAGGTVSYTLSFTTANQNYQFSNVAISGTPEIIYQAVTGLSVTAVAGTSTKSGRFYTWPYTFTVSNNSGQNLDGWRIVAPFSASESVSSMPPTVNFTQTADQLIIYSTQPIANGTSFQFVANLTSTDQRWVLSGIIVEGKF